MTPAQPFSTGFARLSTTDSFFPEDHLRYNPKYKQDEKLGDKLKAELPGILNWALVGLKRVNKKGFTSPKSSKDLRRRS